MALVDKPLVKQCQGPCFASDTVLKEGKLANGADEDLGPQIPEEGLPEEEIPEEDRLPGKEVDVDELYRQAKRLSPRGKGEEGRGREKASPPETGQQVSTSSPAAPGGAPAAERMGAGPVGAKPPEKPGGTLSRFFGKGKGIGEAAEKGAGQAAKTGAKKAGTEAAKDVGRAAAKEVGKAGVKTGAKLAAGAAAAPETAGLSLLAAAALEAGDRLKNYLIGVVKNPGEHKLFIVAALALIWLPVILVFGIGICGFGGCYGRTPAEAASDEELALLSERAGISSGTLPSLGTGETYWCVNSWDESNPSGEPKKTVGAKNAEEAKQKANIPNATDVRPGQCEGAGSFGDASGGRIPATGTISQFSGNIDYVLVDVGKRRIFFYSQGQQVGWASANIAARGAGGRGVSTPGSGITPLGEFKLGPKRHSATGVISGAFGSNMGPYFILISGGYVPGSRGVGLHGGPGVGKQQTLPPTAGCVRIPNNILVAVAPRIPDGTTIEIKQ